MIDDMAIRNMSPLTQKAYVRAVKNFSLHFRRSPDALTFEDVRAYQLHLVSRGLEATTINQIMCALRFLYGTTLGKKDASEEIKLARQSDPLPVVLSRDEVARFLKAVPDLRWRTALVTIYAAGLRVSEAVALTIKDIDSARMDLAMPYPKMPYPKRAYPQMAHPQAIARERSPLKKAPARGSRAGAGLVTHECRWGQRTPSAE
jgi:integrase/recombinase XerD